MAARLSGAIGLGLFFVATVCTGRAAAVTPPPFPGPARSAPAATRPDAPATSDEPDTPAAAARGLAALAQEVSILVELGAFPQPLPPRLARVHGGAVAELASLDRPELERRLHAAEEQGIDALASLTEGADPPRPEVRRALGPLVPADWRAIAEQRTIELPAPIYVVALDELSDLSPPAPDSTGVADATGSVADGAGDEAGDDATSNASNADEAASSDNEATDTADGAADAGDEAPAADGASDGADDAGAELGAAPGDVVDQEAGPGGIGVAPIAGGLLGLAPVIVGGLVWRRRQLGAEAPADLSDVVEAGRKLARAGDEATLRQVVVTEAAAIVHADTAVLLSRSDRGLTVEAAAGPLAGTVAAGLPPLQRVADTSQTWRGALGGAASGCAAIAVALAETGHVVGVLVAARGPGRPFSAVESARLEQLAPLVAAGIGNASRHSELAELSLSDPLTRLANRRRLEGDLQAAAQLADATSIGFVMIDVDHFKTYNDTHGHPAGDELLRRLADVLAQHVRPGDVVYRYGGEEFSVLLRGADRATATEIGERVCRAVYDADLPGGSSQPHGRVTVSVGMAVGPANDTHALTRNADAALYDAKHDGRNRAVLSGLS